MCAGKRLGLKSAYKIANPQFHGKGVSGAFRGRDVFAVAAARLAAGGRPSQAGDRITKPVRLPSPKPRLSNGSQECSVIHIDSFGNVVTNATMADVYKQGDGRAFWAELDNRRIKALPGDFSELRPGELAVIEGSQGYVELAVREGSAALKTGLRISDTLRLKSVSRLSGRSSKSPASARHRQFV